MDGFLPSRERQMFYAIPVIPAQAGIHSGISIEVWSCMDSRFRGKDNRNCYRSMIFTRSNVAKLCFNQKFMNLRIIDFILIRGAFKVTLFHISHLTAVINQ